jgi:hypothetical protein
MRATLVGLLRQKIQKSQTMVFLAAVLLALVTEAGSLQELNRKTHGSQAIELLALHDDSHEYVLDCVFFW